MRRQLSIEARSTLFGSFNRNFGALSLPAYQQWRYDERFNRVAEPEFLTIAGFEDESTQAAHFGRVITSLTVTAFFLLGLSIGLRGVGIWASEQEFSHEFGSPERERYSDLVDALMVIAIAVDLSAIVTTFVLLARGENGLTLEHAVVIRDDYNSRLQ